MKIPEARLLKFSGTVVVLTMLGNLNCGGGGSGGHAGSGGNAGAAAGTGGRGGTAGATAGTGGRGGGAAGAGGAVAGSGGSAAGAGAGGGGRGGAAAGAGGSAAGAGGSAAGSGAGGGGGGAAGAGGSVAGSGGSAAGSGGVGGGQTDGGSLDAPAFAGISVMFDAGEQGFGLNNIGSNNLLNLDGGVPPTLTWDPSVGNPTPGSIQVTATFTDFDQVLQPVIVLNPNIDLTGRTLHAWVRLDADDAGMTFNGGVKLEVASLFYLYPVNAPVTRLSPGIWTDVTLDLVALKNQFSSFDPSQIALIQVQFSTDPAPDGGTGTFTPVSVSFHIDSVTDGTGLPPPPVINHTFDKTSQEYTTVASGTPDGGVLPALTFDPAVGNPNPGSLALAATFTDYDQSVSAQTQISPATNVTGKMIRAWVQLDTGTFTAGYAFLHATSGNMFSGRIYAAAPAIPLTAGGWTALTFDPAAAASATPMFDPTSITEVGVQIGTGNPPDGGTFPGSESLNFHIDSIVAE